LIQVRTPVGEGRTGCGHADDLVPSV
jgi:hypothetical protein